ncbi:MAG TPA: hypothetical protein VNS31_00670 [Ramlibacter sp.]|nr:hypothetical protein [Ramlibacter sp.]
MKRILKIAIAVAGVAALAACSERPQTLDSGVKVDAQAFQGTGLAYAVPGWKQGDKSSWEQHEKVRTQMGQNEYTRVN